MASNYTFTNNGVLYDMQDLFIQQTFFNQGPITVGTIWSCGYGTLGNLGSGSVANTSSPVQLVPTVTNWKSLSAGIVSAAIKSDGTLWMWGNSTTNIFPTLGVSTPVQIGTLTNWKQVSSMTGTGSLHMTKTDGTLWAIGQNSNGVLGVGNTTNYSSPVQVGSSNSWNYVARGGYGSNMMAVKTDGTLWACGYNGNGVLGNGKTTDVSTPIQIGSLANWSNVAVGYNFSYMVKTDGTLWACGYVTPNAFGNFSSPVQVGALTNWKQVAAAYNVAAAVKTDGTLWAWGVNQHGETGTGAANGAFVGSPTQVGALTNWKSVSMSQYMMAAVKTDGTLWTCGYNNVGQLGLGNTTDRSTPVQVGALNTWSQASAGYQAIFGMKQ